MPWLNLGALLKELLRKRIDPEEIGVYVPEEDLDDDADSGDDSQDD